MPSRTSYYHKLAGKVARNFFATEFWSRVARMAPSEALKVLGFPVGAKPTKEEVAKAYRVKALENHPDRGGSTVKMVEVNAAKEVMDRYFSLGGPGSTYSPPSSSGYDYTPPPPPKKDRSYRPDSPNDYETVKGTPFQEAKENSNLPLAVDWYLISNPLEAITGERPGRRSHDIYYLIGTAVNRMWVAAFRHTNPWVIYSEEKSTYIQYEESWSIQAVGLPLDGFSKVPSVIKALTSNFEPPMSPKGTLKWLVRDRSIPILTAKELKKPRGSGGATLKAALEISGLMPTKEVAPGKVKKYTVEIIPVLVPYDPDSSRPRSLGSFDFAVRVNGRDEKLSDATVLNLRQGGFMYAVFGSQGPSDRRPKQVHLIRSKGAFGVGAAQAIRMLADSLTTEPSWLQIALEAAAESYESEDSKAKTASCGMVESSIWFGCDLLDTV